MTVYLLHFDRPFHHAQHYVGYTGSEDISSRIQAHHDGNGAKLLAAAMDAGISFTVARVWPGADRNFERYIKNMKCTPRYCPECRARFSKKGDHYGKSSCPEKTG